MSERAGKKTEKVIPIGSRRAFSHTLPENGREYFSFGEWDGKQYKAIQPSGEEAGHLIQDRIDSIGKFVD